MHCDHVVLTLEQLDSHIVFHSLIKEHPVLTKLIIEEFPEISCSILIEILQDNPVGIKHSSQHDDTCADLEVLELKDAIICRVVLLLNESVLSLQQDRLCQLLVLLDKCCLLSLLQLCIHLIDFLLGDKFFV